MMKLTYLIPVLFLVMPGYFHPTLLAQKNDYFWQVPNSNGIDFRFDPPIVFFLPSSEYSESAASIASDEGEPRFYLDARLGMVIWDTLSGKVLDATAESKIRNKDGIVVENGDSIKTDQSISQALVLPQPGKKERYYFFTFWNIEEFVKPCSLYYHVVDGTANGGKGKVIQKNVSLFPQYMAQKITATRHANGKDWWIITHNYTGGKYYVFLLSEQGIAEPLIQEIGLKYEAGFWGQDAMVGVLQFSPQGDKLVNFMGSTVKQIEILYFDRCTGCLSPFNKEIDLSEDWYGGTFSPDGNLLYTNIGTRMIQLDLEASDITSSLTEIGWSSFRPSKYQIAPNGKIYINDSFENYLFSINEPNIKGNACNFKDSALHLNNNMPGMCRIDLPNMPNFRLGASVPTYERRDTVVCPGDSVVIGLPETCGYAYRWTPGRGLSDSTAAMPDASPRWTTTYTRETYSPRFSCVSRYDVYHLIINEKPVPPCTVTHRSNNLSQELFSIHPNPAQETITIRLSSAITGIVLLRLTDLSGRLVKETSLDSEEGMLSLSEVSAGCYLLTVSSAQGQQTVKLMVE